MTKIGKIIREEGIQEVIQEGRLEGKSELLIKQLIKNFKKFQMNILEKLELYPQI